MSLWKKPIDLSLIEQRSKDTLADFLHIEWTEITDESITARMHVSSKVHQPLGIMHGGASCVLAETIGSTAANYALDEGMVAVGLDLNTNHIRSIRSGYVYAVATPLHIGRQTQVWHIPITNEQGQTISVSRLTMMNLPKEAK